VRGHERVRGFEIRAGREDEDVVRTLRRDARE
jgi:hypothetical protein